MMVNQCSSTSSGDRDVSISSPSGIMNIRNEKGINEECNLNFQPLEDKYNVLVANFTSVILDCKSESFTIAGEEYCRSSESFCVALSESRCNGTLSIPGCMNLTSADPPAAYFNGHADAQGHGLTMEYQFYNCKDFYTQPSSTTHSHPTSVSAFATESESNAVGRNVNMNEAPLEPNDPEESGTSSNLVGILVPILLLSFILVLITCLYLFLKHRAKRRARRNHPEPVTFQQYISTVGGDNYVMSSDIASGSNLTLEFGRSYESVPRGEVVPVYPVIGSESNYSLSESIEDRRNESVKPRRQDIQRLKKSSDTFSISNFSHSNAPISKADVHSAVRNAPKYSTHNREVMTQSLNDLTRHTDSEQRDDASVQPYNIANDVNDRHNQSRGRREKPKFKIGGPSVSSQRFDQSEASTSKGARTTGQTYSKEYNNYAFVDDGIFDKDDY